MIRLNRLMRMIYEKMAARHHETKWLTQYARLHTLDMRIDDDDGTDIKFQGARQSS